MAEEVREAHPRVDPDEEEYRESEDEDFNPEQEGVVNEDEEEGDDDEAFEEPDDEEDKKNLKTYEDVQGTGLIKTRAQRELEARQEKQYKLSEKSNIDVDAMWKSMNASSSILAATDEKKEDISNGSKPSAIASDEITIKRTYKFAGEVVTEEKTVKADSAEAKAYLAQLDKKEPHPSEKQKEEVAKKPLKGPRRKKRSSIEAELNAAKPKKMNTLEKSRLDWAGFVDKEGIHDELKHHNKGGYLHQQDFLNMVDQRLDQDYKEGRKKASQSKP
ncbi:SWR1-complex protein 5 [Trichomonascus vanleenenianus]|uniref:BCNT domain-containing protein n=1 Tax=Trichomonascus vanleenenianus TaxID=2268995 RepID=UPI003EC9B951